MKTEKFSKLDVKTVAAKFVVCGRRFLGESLLGVAAIGAGWTAGNVQLQLSRVA